MNAEELLCVKSVKEMGQFLREGFAAIAKGLEIVQNAKVLE